MMIQLLIIIILLYYVKFIWRARHQIAFAKHFRTNFKSIPILGHAYVFVNCRYDSGIKRFSEEILKQGGATCLWNMHRLYFVVADPIIAEFLMKSCLEKDDAVKLTLSVVGNGSFFADVNTWRPRRKVLVPIFSQKYLMQFENVFSKQSMILVEQLKKVAGQGSLSMSKYVTRYTMDSVFETTLGVEIHTQKNPDQKLLRAFINALRLISDRIIKPWLHFTSVYKLTADYKQLMDYVDTFYSFIQEVITNKRKELAIKKNKKIVELNDEDRFKTVLELMLESSGYNDLMLREEIGILFIAGTDSSALTVSFISVLLARYPHVQEKVYQELEKVFGHSDRPILYEDLPHLKYLEAVIKESLRLYPPGPFLLRKVTKDTVLPSGVTLPKDTGIIINIHAMHRNPEYWGDDADQFRPERFLDTNPAAFMAFSSGPRNCIAYRYAMMSMKTVLSTLLRNFRILPVSQEDLGQPVKLKFDIMLRADDDFQVKLVPRK